MWNRIGTFLGQDRFHIKRELGRGGMGVVYEAYDRERDETVALKILHLSEPSAIYRFKREFRTLADVAHRNLVHLHELVADGDLWFFTMEYVKGEDFLQHVRPGFAPPEPSNDPTIADGDPIARFPAESQPTSSLRTGRLIESRLRVALRQLAEGVSALHEAGKVHRDLKPSNVLICATGRLVILDFGIAAEYTRAIPLHTADHLISGTVEYMSPEQGVGERCGPASDWYALGVLLYESLTGRLPFLGTPWAIVGQKQSDDPPHPNDIAGELPEDLVDLCISLLRREPDNRPTGEQVLQSLGVPRTNVVVDPRTRPTDEVPLVGRDEHLDALADAFVNCEQGQCVVVCVNGPSGIGKTTLVRHFTDSLVRDESAVVLAGRCFARESVPYKALDGVIDMLSRLLNRFPSDTIEQRLPREITALVRVFPVLSRVDAVARRVDESSDIPDRRELRRRAFAALLELLGAIGDERPVVIHIDDLQWADPDSAELLDYLLDARNKRLLFLLSFRSEDVPGTPLLQSLLDRSTADERRILEVGPLSTDHIEEFASLLLRLDRSEVRGRANALMRESAGNPFLIDQMLRFALGVEQEARTPAINLGEMLHARFDQLPAGAGPLMDVLAVAGQPIRAEVACRAAALEGDERRLLRSLQIAHLLRASTSGERIEVYHDRIREHVAGRLSAAATRSIHLRLAECLESAGIHDPERLYEHYLGAGETGRAAHYAAEAAQVAHAGLAFEHAAALYRRALELVNAEAGTVSWLVGLGDALSSGGRGGAAAEAYLEASRQVTEPEASELQRRAGEQLLISGRLEEGLVVIGGLLEKIDLQLLSSPRKALLSLLLRRAILRLRGLGFTERPESEVPGRDLTRIDACWAVAEGLALIDTIQGAAFQTLHLLLALKAGEPYRVARALAIEAGFLSSAGIDTRATRLLGKAERLTERLGSQYHRGLCVMIGSVTSYHGGRWSEARRYAVEAERILSNHLSFVAWHLTTAKVYHIHILAELGEIDPLSRLSQRFLADALDRGNLFAARVFRTGWSSLVWLSNDDVHGAKEALDDAVAGCPEGTFPHWQCVLAGGLIDLYHGDPDRALRTVTTAWRPLQKSFMLRVQTVRVIACHLRARCHLAMAHDHENRETHLRAAKQDARRLQREGLDWARGLAQLVYAGVHVADRNEEAAMRSLQRAIDVFESHDMALWRAVAQRRLGEISGGSDGRALIAEADNWMMAQSIRNPERMARAFATVP